MPLAGDAYPASCEPRLTARRSGLRLTGLPARLHRLQCAPSAWAGPFSSPATLADCRRVLGADASRHTPRRMGERLALGVVLRVLPREALGRVEH